MKTFSLIKELRESRIKFNKAAFFLAISTAFWVDFLAKFLYSMISNPILEYDLVVDLNVFVVM